MAQVVISDDWVEPRGPRGPSPRRPVGRRLSGASLASSRGSSPAGSPADASSPAGSPRRGGGGGQQAGGSRGDALLTSSALPPEPPGQTLTVAQMAATCMSTLETVRMSMIGTEDAKVASSPGAHVEAQQQARCTLLEDKRVLGSAMEELRSTMRALQEGGERCTFRSRTCAARLLATRALTAASRDEVCKVQAQLRRAREQLAEHRSAKSRVQEELLLSAAAFGEALSQEAEANICMRQEVDQLTQVTEDLESRLRAKSADIAKAKEANAEATSKVATALERWRNLREARKDALDHGPLGDCLAVLRLVASGQGLQSGSTAEKDQPPVAKLQSTTADGHPAAAPRQNEASATSLGRPPPPQKDFEALDLAELRHLVSCKEEQLATLHRKIRFLTVSGS